VLFGGSVSIVRNRSAQERAQAAPRAGQIVSGTGDRSGSAIPGWVSSPTRFDARCIAASTDGLHYAMGYCGSGVGMASYLGMRLGQQVLGSMEADSAFSTHWHFPTQAVLHRQRPWFLAPSVAAVTACGTGWKSDATGCGVFVVFRLTQE
jgi:glycine/D-amino acid oxidase-like deaminating enzyme